MKRVAACILLVLVTSILTVPTYARTNKEDRAAQKSAKAQQKTWNKFVKRQEKAEKKAEKRINKLNKRQRSPAGRS